MSKKRKSSHYVAEKKARERALKKIAEKKQKRNKLILTALIWAACILAVIGTIIGVTFALGFWDYYPEATHHATIEIEDYGTVHLELYGNDAPETVENFIKLAEEGYYDELPFRTIIDGFKVQGGEGMGTPSIKGEFSANGFRNRVRHERGVISMVRSDDSADSAADEFFILLKDYPRYNGSYAAFGKVTSGIEVLEKMCADTEPYDDEGSIAPHAQPRIKSISIHGVHEH